MTVMTEESALKLFEQKVKGAEYGPKVLLFALDMFNKLEQNRHKGTWTEMGIGDCLLRCSDELTELFEACAQFNYQKPPGDAIPAIRAEAADVANFLLFVDDNCGVYSNYEFVKKEV